MTLRARAAWSSPPVAPPPQVPAPTGYDLAAGLGHTIVPPVPSLFTFTCAVPLLRAWPGLSAGACA